MDTLLSLRVLAAVAEQKSFSAVAERMGLSPAMTSKHVQHAERRVGARLLNRNSRNVSLTEAGEQYLAAVRPLLEGLEEAESQLSTETVAARGKLKISMPVWMSTPSFSQILKAFSEENPQVVFDFDLSGRKINMVEEGIDLALRVTFALDEGLIAKKLGEITFMLVASPEYLDRHGRPETASDLDSAPMLAYSEVAASGRLRFGGEQGLDIRLNPVLVTENESLIYQMVKAGMGFAMLPDWLTRKDLELGNLEVVLPKTEWPRLPINAIYADRSYLPAKVRRFLDFLAGPNGLNAKRN